MADGILGSGIQLGHCAVALGDNEDWIVAESVVAAWSQCNRSLARAG